MFPAEEKLRCVLRELAMRRRVYPRRITAGYMKPVVAMREIALMEEIVRDYEQQVEKERLV